MRKINKGKLIIWDKAKKQWIATDNIILEGNKDLEQELQLSLKNENYPEGIGSPLNKIDSASSEDAYNMYESYYRHNIQSQGAERGQIHRIIEPIHNIDIRNNRGQFQERKQDDEKIIYNEEFTKEYLNDLVNRVNPLPIVENRLYVDRISK